MKEFLEIVEENFAEESAFAEGLTGADPDMNGTDAPWTEKALTYFFGAAKGYTPGVEAAESLITYGNGEKVLTVKTGPSDAAAVLFAVKALSEARSELHAVFRIVTEGDADISCEELRNFVGKGMLTFDIVRKFAGLKTKGLNLRSVDGGESPAAAARRARAVVNAPDMAAYDTIREKAAGSNSETSPVKCRGTGKSLEILSEYKEGSSGDAIAVLMRFLGELNFASEEINDTVAFFNDHIGDDGDGHRIGCAVSDETSGALEWNTWRVKADEKSVTFSTRVSYPVTSDPNDIYAGIAEVTDRYGMGIVKIDDDEPACLAAEDSNDLLALTKHYAAALYALALKL
ncbi:MAG: hypothetical protein ACOYJO_03230 [Eubacterium sp.]|jgi:hypothetical protein